MSEGILHKLGHLQILQLAVLQDNYSYLIHDTISGATPWPLTLLLM